MLKRNLQSILATAAIVAFSTVSGQGKPVDSGWQKDFNLSSCTLQTNGRNEYFILQPGFQLLLEGGGTRLQITVTAETRQIDGVMTRVVEEREWKDGKLYEVARNYFAICAQTKDVYYFGEDVDFYENGKVVKHDGTWHAGKNGNKAGLIMPSSPKLNMRYYQELAPDVAMDRAEIVSLDETCRTPAGTFSGCLKVMESSALKPNEKEYKYYAPGIGLVRDGDLQLVRYGFLKGK